MNEPKPYSFLLWDGLKDELAIEQQREKGLAADSKSAEKSLATAHHALDQANTKRRPIKDADTLPDANGDPTPQGGLTLERERAQVALRKADIEVYALRTEICQAKHNELTKKIEPVGHGVAFSAADRDKQLGILAEAEARLKAQRGQTERQLRQLDEKEHAVEVKLKDEKASRASQEAASDAWRSAADAYQAQIVVLDERIEWLDRQRRLWRHRYEVVSGKPDAEQLRGWLKELSEFRDELNDNLHALENRHELAQTGETALKGALAGAKAVVPAYDGEPVVKESQEFRDARLHENSLTCAAPAFWKITLISDFWIASTKR